MAADRTVDLWLAAVGLSEAEPRLSEWLRSDAGSPDPGTPLEELLPPRYAARGRLGAGGMGEVHRVWDLLLEREVALKVVHPVVAASPEALGRFHREARALAGLEHPAVVPIHDLGVLQDGRPYFTMRVVRGTTLREVIREVHGRGAGVERLVDRMVTAGDALARAHERGLVHRDFKPDNVLVGEGDETLVVDWGLVASVGPRGEEPPTGGGAAALPGASELGTAEAGAVVGTPLYMAPEQARGEVVGPAADTWAFGATLHEVLLGAPPFHARSRGEVLAAVRRGIVPPLPESAGRVVEELRELLLRCLVAEPERRPALAEVVAGLRAWRAGELRRERARAAVAEAEAARAEANLLAAEAEARAAAAAEALAAVPLWAPVAEKLAAWEMEDRAEATRRRAAQAGHEADAAIEAALVLAPDLADAHALRARQLRARHAAETREAPGDEDDPSGALAELGRHVRALPRGDARRPPLERYLAGVGAVSLVPERADATVRLHPWVRHERRLVLGEAAWEGRGPLREHVLPAGRWLAVVSAPGHTPARLSFEVRRDEHWDGVPPGGAAPFPVHLPAEGELGPEDRYVPAGWAWVGGDPVAPGSLPGRRVWVDGFVMRRYPARNREWIEFLDGLWAAGRREEAERSAPRERGVGGAGNRIYGHDGQRYQLVPDADGDVWEPDWPTIMVDHACAWAYARWEAERTGRPWRLPGELEWEKAARGADRRWMPWGDYGDPSWYSGSRSFPGRARIEAVDARPVDESPYGVVAMAGHVVEWTADRFRPEGPPTPGDRVVVPDGRDDGVEAWAERTASHRIVGRGGSRVTDLKFARAAFRTAVEPWARASNIGVRLARDLGPKAGG